MGFIRLTAYTGGTDTALKALLAILVIAGFGAAGYLLLKSEDFNLRIMAPKEFGIIIDGEKVEPRRQMAGFSTYDLRLSYGSHTVTVKASGKNDYEMKFDASKTEVKLRFGLDSTGRIDLLN